PRQGVHDDRGGRQRARRDQHLVRARGQPAGLVVRGDRLLELRDAAGVVAVTAEVGRDVVDGPGERGGHARRRRGGGRAEVDEVRPVQQRHEDAVDDVAAPARQVRVGPGPVSCAGEAALPQERVRAGHRGARQPERGGELALAGQPGADGHAAVADDEREGARQPLVGGRGVEPPHEGGGPVRGQGERHVATFSQVAIYEQSTSQDAGRVLENLTPRQQLRAPRMPRRLVQLILGLWLYGWSMALMIHAGLGLDPWDVFHDGLAQRSGLTFGTVVTIVGALVLLLWIPLRQMPGLGTVANVLVIGVATDVGLAVLPRPDGLALQVAVLGLGVVLNGLAGALYIGAQLGPGPRDGLTTGLARRTGRSLRLVRTGIEVTVLAAGFLLGGVVGLGTVLYALAIGPLVQLMLPWVVVRLGTTDPSASEPEATAVAP